MTTVFKAHTSSSKVDKRYAGRTDAPDTPVEIRPGGERVNPSLQRWIYERMGRHLGKYGPVIERAQVRFGDQNGPRGGGKCCTIQLAVSALPQIVVEECADTLKEAFDLAVHRAERAARRSMQKHGFRSKKTDKHAGGVRPFPEQTAKTAPRRRARDAIADEGSLIGRRVGQGAANLALANERPERQRGDALVDTAAPGVSASDRRAGGAHSARRNTKVNTRGMTRALEDSVAERPSRKSTRKGANRVKADNPLTQRTKGKVSSPRARASHA